MQHILWICLIILMITPHIKTLEEDEQIYIYKDPLDNESLRPARRLRNITFDYFNQILGKNHKKSDEIDYLNFENNNNINKSLEDDPNTDNTLNDNGDSLTPKYWALFLFLFPAFTIFGNTLVVISVIREKNLHTLTNYFVVSLAIADLTVAAAVMPFAVYYEVI
jgi:hypothetical protein